VRDVIEALTDPGDFVFDPFFGGGTTLVEAGLLGRVSAGTDLNELAEFVARAKTTPLSSDDLRAVVSWFANLFDDYTIQTKTPRPEEAIAEGYQKHLTYRTTWRLRKLLEIADARVHILTSADARQFARCVILRTGQWALDSRREIPNVAKFREKLRTNLDEMVAQATGFANQANYVRPIICRRSAVGLEQDEAIKRLGAPKLILTSPPYPGVYVTYHRWKIQGRLETAAPYWLAECKDGSGMSYYTMGHRKQKGLTNYFGTIRACFRSIRAVCSKDTTVVQVVGFNDPEWQLLEYLDAMQDAGFAEVIPNTESSADGRIWRDVPGRRWYALYQETAKSTSKEVVLIHRPR